MSIMTSAATVANTAVSQTADAATAAAFVAATGWCMYHLPMRRGDKPVVAIAVVTHVQSMICLLNHEQ